MADLVDGVARHLDGLGLLSYDPTGKSGDTFVGTMPGAPGEAVSLTLYDGGEQNAKLAYDVVRLQVRVRGDEDPRTSHARAYAIYSELNGLADTTLPDGTEIIICSALGTPGPLGPDRSGRYEHVVNFTVEHEAPTTHRQ